MKRVKVRRKPDRKIFAKTAKRTKAINVVNNSRGGTRL